LYTAAEEALRRSCAPSFVRVYGKLGAFEQKPLLEAMISCQKDSMSQSLMEEKQTTTARTNNSFKRKQKLIKASSCPLVRALLQDSGVDPSVLREE
jgi:hypothetical protein